MRIKCFNLTGSKTALIWLLDSVPHRNAAAGAFQAVIISLFYITNSQMHTWT